MRRLNAWLIVSAVGIPFLLLLYSAYVIRETKKARASETQIWCYRMLELYKQGKIAEAREKASEYVNEELQTLSKKDLDLMDVKNSLHRLAMLVSSISSMERKLFDTKNEKQDESSKMFLDEIVNKLEEGANSLEARKISFDGIRPRMDEFFTGALLQAIKDQIALGGREQVAALYEKHKEFLESIGMTKEKIVSEVFEAPKVTPEPETELVHTAKNELPQIREVLIGYYNALSKMDVEALQKRMIDKESAEKVMDEIKRERDIDKNFDKIISVVFDDKTKIEVEKEIDGYIQLRVKGIEITFEKSGETKTVRENEIFKIARREGEWKICVRR